jgi:hypothetical protein
MEKAQQRLTKTLTKIFGKIAESLMHEAENPHILDDWDICPDKRSQNKELGFLSAAGALHYSSIKSSEHTWRSNHSYDFETLFNEHSKDYATPLIFPEVPESVNEFISQDVLNRGFNTNTKHLKDAGYKEVRYMRSGEKIYAYHNLSIYDVLEATTEPNYHGSSNLMKEIKVYPKVMLESRLKSVIKAVMKKYCEEDLLAYLNNTFGVELKGLSQKLGNDSVEFSHTLRTTARYPVTFSEQYQESSINSYTNEYKRIVDKINFEYDRIKEFKDKIIAAGGTSAVLNGYIKTSIDNLIGKSLTLINGKEDDKDALVFILDHRDLITYDYLYNS